MLGIYCYGLPWARYITEDLGRKLESVTAEDFGLSPRDLTCETREVKSTAAPAKFLKVRPAEFPLVRTACQRVTGISGLLQMRLT